jgi:hypothetical protein
MYDGHLVRREHVERVATDQAAPSRLSGSKRADPIVA